MNGAPSIVLTDANRRSFDFAALRMTHLWQQSQLYGNNLSDYGNNFSDRTLAPGPWLIGG